MDARRRRHGALASLIFSSLLLGSMITLVMPHVASAGTIRPGADPVEAITITTRTRASWYGTGFHGKASASGRIFNQAARTAAHRTLPFGTKVEVTNLRNGRRLVVEVTDRGPYVAGRGIDVSAGAANTLGFRARGVAAVRMAIRVPRSKGLSLLGPSSAYTLWVPPRRGSLTSAPVLLGGGSEDSRPLPSPATARRVVASSEEQTIWQ